MIYIPLFFKSTNAHTHTHIHTHTHTVTHTHTHILTYTHSHMCCVKVILIKCLVWMAVPSCFVVVVFLTSQTPHHKAKPNKLTTLSLSFPGFWQPDQNRSLGSAQHRCAALHCWWSHIPVRAQPWHSPTLLLRSCLRWWCPRMAAQGT